MARRFSIREASGVSGLDFELDDLDMEDCSGDKEARSLGLVDAEPDEERSFIIGVEILASCKLPIAGEMDNMLIV